MENVFLKKKKLRPGVPSPGALLKYKQKKTKPIWEKLKEKGLGSAPLWDALQFKKQLLKRLRNKNAPVDQKVKNLKESLSSVKKMATKGTSLLQKISSKSLKISDTLTKILSFEGDFASFSNSKGWLNSTLCNIFSGNQNLVTKFESGKALAPTGTLDLFLKSWKPKRISVLFSPSEHYFEEEEDTLNLDSFHLNEFLTNNSINFDTGVLKEGDETIIEYRFGDNVQTRFSEKDGNWATSITGGLDTNYILSRPNRTGGYMLTKLSANREQVETLKRSITSVLKFYHEKKKEAFLLEASCPDQKYFFLEPAVPANFSGEAKKITLFCKINVEYDLPFGVAVMIDNNQNFSWLNQLGGWKRVLTLDSFPYVRALGLLGLDEAIAANALLYPGGKPLVDVIAVINEQRALEKLIFKIAKVTRKYLMSGGVNYSAAYEILESTANFIVKAGNLEEFSRQLQEQAVLKGLSKYFYTTAVYNAIVTLQTIYVSLFKKPKQLGENWLVSVDNSLKTIVASLNETFEHFDSGTLFQPVKEDLVEVGQRIRNSVVDAADSSVAADIKFWVNALTEAMISQAVASESGVETAKAGKKNVAKVLKASLNLASEKTEIDKLRTEAAIKTSAFDEMQNQNAIASIIFREIANALKKNEAALAKIESDAAESNVREFIRKILNDSLAAIVSNEWSEEELKETAIPVLDGVVTRLLEQLIPKEEETGGGPGTVIVFWILTSIQFEGTTPSTKMAGLISKFVEMRRSNEESRSGMIVDETDISET